MILNKKQSGGIPRAVCRSLKTRLRFLCLSTSLGEMLIFLGEKCYLFIYFFFFGGRNVLFYLIIIIIIIITSIFAR